MEFIDGINCGDEPQAKFLYIAAEKIGAIYHKSKINMTQIDNSVVKKYTLTKEKILYYIKIINTHFNLPPIEALVNYIFEKYHDRTLFVNHHDMQFKNLIYNDDLHIIDWGGCIQTFFSDLYRLIQQADEVDADVEEIKKRYLEYSKIRFITDEDICIGGIIACIKAIFELLIFDCPVEWAVDSYNELQRLIQKVDFHYDSNTVD